MSRLKILFLCTGNSCRSQMAEGWARHLRSAQLEAFSAGLETHGLNPHAVRVMAEAGVDISRQFSKTPAELGAVEFDYVITVCGHADEHCPRFRRRHGWFTWASRILRNSRRTCPTGRKSWRCTGGYGMKSAGSSKPCRTRCPKADFPTR